MTDWVISRFAIIRKGGIIIGSEQSEFPYSGNDDTFFKELYKQLEIDYPKFYKMDRLCKLAFLTSEYLFKGNQLQEKYPPANVALIFSNSGSSNDIDFKHNATIFDRQNYFPKPAYFVYTLPNILMGEISIRHQFKGENIFFVSEKFDVEFLTDYVEDLLNHSRHNACILGWTEYIEGNFNSAMFFIEKSEQADRGELLTASNLERKFNTFAAF